ncbi:MAG TPA: FtsH protease activity modulator HflK [Candidatus Binatia bacterium]|nr:FtsH protease activity modulator HflK [Candidatus Binatia bacterium]
MDRRQSYEDFSPPEELRQTIENLRRWKQRLTGGSWPWAILAIILLLWLGSGLYVVGPGERGVVLLFRAATAEQTEPGLRYRLPWPIQSHAVVDIAQVRRAEVGFRTVADASTERGGRGGARTVPREALMLTGDENIVELQFFVQYRVQDPVKFLFGASDPEGILHTSAEVALRSAVGRNTIDYTMTDGRVEVQEQAKGALQELLDTYQTGLLVSEARLLVVDPPSEVRDAFHDVVRALEDRDRLVKEADGYREGVVPNARGEAAQMVQQAEAYKAQRVIRAQGDAERFLKILAEYDKAKAITRDRLYLESVERIMPTIEKFILDSGGKAGVLPLLPLKGLAASPAPVAPEKTPTANADRR